MNDELTPVLIACGQVTDRSTDGSGLNPIELMAEAVRNAVDDAGSDRILNEVDHLITAGLTVDAVGLKTPLTGAFSNVPRSVANALGIEPTQLLYCTTGGNTPQLVVNHFADQIAQGQAGTVLMTGGEALHTMRKRFKNPLRLVLPKGKWSDHPGGHPAIFGEPKPGGTQHESAYGLNLPANTYPLFENALQQHYERTHEQHRQAIGELFHRFTKIAANNPYAWFQQERSPQELTTANDDNRYIAFPYTKLLNSMIYVNQSAAVIMTSVARAKALGIKEDNWVYLHGCADAHDIWNVTERVNYYSSPAMRRAGQEALSMAGKAIDDMDFFDLYSCFPSAVQIGCDEFGIEHDDPRGLSLTGGLPYFGGPGNNYSMHAIAQMMMVLRQHPGKYGMLNANGWFLTKHSVGVYSNTPLTKAWHRSDPQSYQQEILQHTGPAFTENPQGSASIETFTVIHNKKNLPQKTIIIGRLTSGERFLATTEKSSQVFERLMQGDSIGATGVVRNSKGKNVFYLE